MRKPGDASDTETLVAALRRGDRDALAALLALHRARLRRMVDPGDREVLARRHFEELSNLEVSALLGIGPAAASRRYVRAIERLRSTLDGDLSRHEGRR